MMVRNIILADYGIEKEIAKFVDREESPLAILNAFVQNVGGL
tara:strand:- start:113 stop:238 length:126 start_codon:yes stop_codon:yes gene_type:complete